MWRSYIIFGIIICSLFAYAGARGIVLGGMPRPGHGGSGVHGMSHK